MAISDRNILITPNTGSSSDPTIQFSGADNDVTAQTITLKATPGGNGSLVFTNSSNQTVFQIANLIGPQLFSVANAGGSTYLAAFNDGKVQVTGGGFGYWRYPRCPAFRVRNSTNASAFSANAQATWNVIDYNNGGYFSSNRFTAPWSGIYFFSTMIMSNSSTRLFYNYRVNGSDVAGTLIESYGGTDYQTMPNYMIRYLQTEDTVDIYVRSNAAYGGSYANFSGVQIG